jgi:ABC-type thiamin/hydroxymethylpyrimidine transport system permease subunit
MRPRYWGLRVAVGLLGLVVLIVGIVAVLWFAPHEYLPCPPVSHSENGYQTLAPVAGALALGVWLLAALLSSLLIRGFRRRRIIATPAGLSRNYSARVGLGCVVSLLVLVTLCTLYVAWGALAHPVFVGC